MLDRPDLPDDAIAAAVRDGYGFSPTSLEFLPIGNDPASWSYRLRAGDEDYFLKLRRGVSPSSFVVPRFLNDRGATRVMAARPSMRDSLWVEVQGYALALYPYIDGRTGGAGGMSRDHWVAYGATMRQVHDTTPSMGVARLLRRETFTHAAIAGMRRLDDHVAAGRIANDLERQFAALWQERRQELLGLVERFEALGATLRAAARPLVICHADVHIWNVLIDSADGGLWIVDWDETLLAPRECDLMFGIKGGIGGGRVGAEEETWFFEGYGRVEVDPVALAYYRHHRAVTDFASYGETVFWMPERSEQTRREAVTRVTSFFVPGQIVELAREADRLALGR
jgi:spectinomycin phosphotransferase